MSRCIACNKELEGFAKHRIFDSEYTGFRPTEDEDLCSTCLSYSKDAYYTSKHLPPEEIQLECEQMFYTAFADVSDPVSALLSDPERNTISVQEV